MIPKSSTYLFLRKLMSNSLVFVIYISWVEGDTCFPSVKCRQSFRIETFKNNGAFKTFSIFYFVFLKVKF